MTDNEWIANIHNVSNAEIFEQLESIGCDGYYRDIWSACIEELQRRVNLTSGEISREVINSEIEKRYCSKHCVVPSEELYCPDNCPARFLKNIVKECPSVPERLQGEWVRKEDVIHSIAKQYSDHNELVPIWLSIGDLNGGTDKGDN